MIPRERWTETQEAVVLAESQMALTAACAVSGEEGMSSERSAPWALSWAKTGGGGERTGVADTRPSNPRGPLVAQLSWQPLQKPDSPSRIAKVKPGGRGGPRHSPFFSAMGQNRPIFPSGCEGKLGVALESLQGLRDLT